MLKQKDKQKEIKWGKMTVVSRELKSCQNQRGRKRQIKDGSSRPIPPSWSKGDTTIATTIWSSGTQKLFLNKSDRNRKMEKHNFEIIIPCSLWNLWISNTSFNFKNRLGKADSHDRWWDIEFSDKKNCFPEKTLIFMKWTFGFRYEFENEVHGPYLDAE